MKFSPPALLTSLLPRLCLLAVLLPAAAALAQTMTVATLVGFIKSSIELKNPDKQVATAVEQIRLTEKFTLADLGDLQSAGVGPKTLAALARLVTQSASLAPPAKAAPAERRAVLPDPSDAEKRDVLEKTREWALDYVKSLPDFVCLEDTYRYVDPHYQPGTEGSWSQEDRVIEKLTFFDHKENYELAQHNDTPTVNKDSASLGGARSTGEWASLLGEIFEPSSHTGFHWMQWATVRGKRAWEYRYTIERQDSHETVSHGDKEKIIAGFSGDVFIEEGTNVVLRVTVSPDIPPDFPVQDVKQIVDYDYQTIGTAEFLLPKKSTVQMRDGHMGSRNDITWRSYRKYSADATLNFDDSDTGQKPAQPPSK